MHTCFKFHRNCIFIFIAFISYFNYVNGSSDVYTGCSLSADLLLFKPFLVGKCEKWNMIIVPMLKTEENEYLGALKSLVETVIGDCKWYYGNINAQFLTKNMDLVKITDPVDFTDLDYRVGCNIVSKMTSFHFQVDEFIYNSNEQQDAYEKMLRYALMNLPLRPPEFGRYILIVTNFERSLSGIVIENNEKLVDKITEYGIQLRTIRVEFDGNRATHINPDQQFSINRIRNISSNYVRVSFIETPSLMSTVQPCPQLSPQERLDHYRYSKHYLVEHWVDRNTTSSLIGALIIIFSIFGVIFAYLCHLRNRKPENYPIINI